MELLVGELVKLNASLQAINNLIGKVSVSDVVTILISVATLVVAYYIPDRIAKRQDRIALFEKRVAVYCDLGRIATFAEVLNDATYNDAADGKGGFSDWRMQKDYVIMNMSALFKCPVGERVNFVTLRTVLSAINDLESSLQMMPFLFYGMLDENEETILEEIGGIFQSLISVVSDIIMLDGPISDEDRVNYINKVHAFIEKYDNKMKEPLKIK